MPKTTSPEGIPDPDPCAEYMQAFLDCCDQTTMTLCDPEATVYRQCRQQQLDQARARVAAAKKEDEKST
jgi:hypothetical protein